MSGCCAAAPAPPTESSSVVITTSRFRHGDVPRCALIHLALMIRTPSLASMMSQRPALFNGGCAAIPFVPPNPVAFWGLILRGASKEPTGKR